MEIIKNELHLFIIWEKARIEEDYIINDIKNELEIISIYEIEWTKLNFHKNLTRFYGINLPTNSNKEKHCGNGKFLLIIVNDNNPHYDFRITSKGRIFVNSNIFDLKMKYRNKTGGGHKIHSTNDTTEFLHDVTLLLGKKAEKYIKKTNIFEVDSLKKVELKVDLFGNNGFESIKDMLFMLNYTINYIVMRNFENLIEDINLSEIDDIDFVVENVEIATSLLNARKINVMKYRSKYSIDISGKSIYIDIRTPGDGYYSLEMYRYILEDRFLYGNTLYVPSKEKHYFSLLYHAFVHKRYLSNKYLIVLNDINKSLFNQNKENTENELFNQLSDFLKVKKFKITEPRDLSVFYNYKKFNLNQSTIRFLHENLVKKTIHAYNKYFRVRK